MRTRSVVAVTLGVLALGIAVALLQPWRQAPESPASVARAPARMLPGPSTPTPPPRGALSLRGRVLDARRVPVAGVEVSATRVMPGESLSQLPCDEELPELPLSAPECATVAGDVLMELIEVGRGGAPVLARATTAADGTFQLDGLPEGTVTLWALGAGGSTLEPDVPTGTDGVELLLEEGASLAGRVVDEAGAPLAGAKVTLFDHEGSRYFELRTDADGRFSSGPLPDVLYGLVASSPGLMPRYVPEVPVVNLQRGLVLHAPRRLVGRVLAGDGPVAGAEVRVRGTSHVTTTDTEGRFAVEPLAPDEYAVEATHAGQHGLAFVRAMEAREAEATVYLGLLFFVEGTVRDEAGAPIADATVAALSRQGEMMKRLTPPTASTSAEGRFRLGPLPSGRTVFIVEADQYLDLRHDEADLTPSTPPPDFTLARATLLDGVVTDTEGQPLADVELDAVLKPTREEPPPEADTDWVPEMQWRGVDTFSAESDAAGRFRLKLDKPGRYVLTVGGGSHVPTRLEVDAPATGLHVALRGGASVKGRVVDSRGEPLPDVDLRVRLGAGSTAQALTTASDDEGRFLLEGLPSGTHTLEASLELAGARHRASRTVEVRGAGTVEISLPMDTGQSVSGIVVDEQGRPLPGAEVEAYAVRSLDDYPNGSPATAKAGPDGRFTVHHLLEGMCVLSASKRGYAQDAREEGRPLGFHVSARTGARDVRLTLRYQGSVSGRVVHADGSPVPRFFVEVEGIAQGKEGAFHLPVERPGRLHLRILAPGHAPAHREVDVEPGQDVDVGEVRLDAGRRVSGRVLDAETSAPVAGAEVRVYPAEQDAPMEVSPAPGAPRTAFDGTFELSPLESHPLRLEVRREGYLPLLQQLGTGDERLELRLSAGARVEGTVRDREGRPVETAVRLTPQSREAREPSRLDALPTEDRLAMLSALGTRYLDKELTHRFPAPGGTFSARGLKPGDYALEVVESVDVEGRYLRFLPQRVRIPASGTVALAIQALSGGATLRVMVEAEWPERLAALRMGLLRGSVPPSATYEELLTLLLTEEVPSLSLSPSSVRPYEGLPAGRYTFLVLLMEKEGRYLAWSEELDVPAEGEVTRELRPVPRPVPATR